MKQTIMQQLVARIKRAGPQAWDDIAARANDLLPPGATRLTRHSLRKLSYGDRLNPGILYVQALLDVLPQVRRRK